MDAKKEAELKEMDAIKKENARLRQQKAEQDQTNKYLSDVVDASKNKPEAGKARNISAQREALMKDE